MELELVLLYLGIGLFGGLIAGLLGVGGGIIFVPLFSHLFKNEEVEPTDFPALVIAHSLCLTALSSLSASVRNHLKGRFFLKLSLICGLSGIITGVGTSYLISNFDYYSKGTFSIVFSLLLVPVIIKMFSRKTKSQSPESTEELNNSKYILPGFAAGLVSALSGLGGGIVMVPILHNWFKKTISEASSISLGAIFVLSTSMVAYYLSIEPLAPDTSFTVGTIRTDLILFMAPGVLLGAPLGVRLADLIEDIYIKFTFAIFATLVLVKTLFFQ